MFTKSNYFVSKGAKKSIILDFNNSLFSNYPIQSNNLLNLKFNNNQFDSLKDNIEWDIHSHIYSIIVEADYCLHDRLFFDHINILNIEHCLFATKNHNLEDLINFIDKLSNCSIASISFILNFNEAVYSNDFLDYFITQRVVKDVVVQKAPFNKNIENKVYYFEDELVLGNLNLTQGGFVVHKNLFSESQAYHTYFNRKLYIGPNGEIKNAPECPETFGFIKDLESPEELKAIVQTPEFQKYWFVHKEITDVCKDCEFRHMCVDNRLPFQRAENEWYHQTECNYNPYIAKWQGEDGYRTLAECGVVSNENDFSIDHEKIAEINKELWGDE